MATRADEAEGTTMTSDQTIEAQGIAGKKVRITLEEWTEILIDRALQKHKEDCPMYKNYADLDKRVSSNETKLKIVQWLTAPFYIGLVGWIVGKITSIF